MSNGQCVTILFIVVAGFVCLGGAWWAERRDRRQVAQAAERGEPRPPTGWMN